MDEQGNQFSKVSGCLLNPGVPEGGQVTSAVYTEIMMAAIEMISKIKMVIPTINPFLFMMSWFQI